MTSHVLIIYITGRKLGQCFPVHDIISQCKKFRSSRPGLIDLYTHTDRHEIILGNYTDNQQKVLKSIKTGRECPAVTHLIKDQAVVVQTVVTSVIQQEPQIYMLASIYDWMYLSRITF